MEGLSVRGIEPGDRARWEELYLGYATFYRVHQTPEMRATVWSWLMESTHEMAGLLAFYENSPAIGLAHFRSFARPLTATTGLFLDDLFVDPDHRGTGAADLLIRAIADKGRARGCSVVRWITAEDNYRARGLYDRVASRTPWVTYDIKL